MASQESAQYSSQYSSQSSYLFSQRTVLLPDNDVLSQSQQLPNERPIIGHLLGMKDKKRFGVDIYADSPLIFGRHKSCDVVVKSEFISNNHCRIYTHQVDFGSVEDILVFCEDTSLNGTWWNGRIIGKGNSVVLCHGDRLRVSKGMDLTYQQIAKSKEIQDPEDYRVVEMEYQITSKRLGAGAFAEVRMALCKRTREQLAVKIMDKNRLHMSQMNGTDFAREVEILKKVNHPNIVRVHDVIETERYIYIFLQMVTGGDLFDYVKSCGKIPEEEAKYLFFQVLQAIEYLHDHDISHRDLKPENILRVTAQPNTRVMITDFGMAKTQTSPMKTMCGTLTYVAPEVLEGQDGYDKSIDCWSLGVILYVMLSGGHPFTTGEEDEVTISQRIRDGRVEFPSQWFEGVSHDAKRLIRSLLVVDPMHRLNSTDAINHPWFNDDCKIIDQYKLNIMIPWWVKEGKISGGDENAERLATRGEGGAGGGKLKTERLRKKHARPEPYPSPSPRPNRHHVSPRVPRTPSRRMASQPLTPSSVQNSMPKVISHALGPTTPTPRRVYHALRLEPLDQHYTTPVEDDEDEENEVGLEDGVRTVPDVANRRARIG